MNYLTDGEMFGAGFQEAGFSFQDKRNRNPNWTDHEIVRFLEMLQEDEIIRDLAANRNKKVFIHVAQRMGQEGAEKTWDQCRIKLKNLKSQFRYVKERIPNIDDLDLEDDDVVRQLISECQGRGISPSSIKHLRFLLRFLKKQKMAVGNGINDSTIPEFIGPLTTGTTGHGTDISGDPLTKYAQKRNSTNSSALSRISDVKSTLRDESTISQDEAAVSPPTSPTPGLRIISTGELTSRAGKRKNFGGGDSSILDEEGTDGSLAAAGYKFIERFNRDMMDQFMEHQKCTQAAFARWEQERWRQERETMERWRQEARDHERQLFGMFCNAMAKCNSALTTILGMQTDLSDSGRNSNKKQRMTKSDASGVSASAPPQNGGSKEDFVAVGDSEALIIDEGILEADALEDADEEVSGKESTENYDSNNDA